MKSTSSRDSSAAASGGGERPGSAAPFWLALASYLVYLAGLVALAVLGKA